MRALNLRKLAVLGVSLMSFAIANGAVSSGTFIEKYGSNNIQTTQYSDDSIGITVKVAGEPIPTLYATILRVPRNKSADSTIFEGTFNLFEKALNDHQVAMSCNIPEEQFTAILNKNPEEAKTAGMEYHNTNGNITMWANHENVYGKPCKVWVNSYLIPQDGVIIALQVNAPSYLEKQVLGLMDKDGGLYSLLLAKAEQFKIIE